MSKIRQAMLLAAGLSTRMRPLTDKIPKPLLPFLGRRVLDHTFDYLALNGIEEVSVNVHHGKEPFVKALHEKHPVAVSVFEEEVILGTGGGIKNMAPFIKDDHFLVTNCDFFTDVDLREAFQFHLSSKAIATMVLVKPPRQGTYKKIGIDRQGQIRDFPYGKSPEDAKKFGLFSGIHIFHRSIFDWMPTEKIFDINKEVYSRLIEGRAAACGYLTSSRWIDVGELTLYDKGQKALRARPLTWMK